MVKSTLHSNYSNTSLDEDDEGFNSFFFILAKYNTSSFKELFKDFLGAKEEKNKLLIEIAKLNEITSIQKSNIFYLEKENLNLYEHIDTFDLSLTGIK